jgi:hypothetical protein
MRKGWHGAERNPEASRFRYMLILRTVAITCAIALIGCAQLSTSAVPVVPGSEPTTVANTTALSEKSPTKPDFGDFKVGSWTDALTGKRTKYFSSRGGTPEKPHSIELVIYCRGGSTMAGLNFPRVMIGSYLLRLGSERTDWKSVNPDRASRLVEIAVDYDEVFALMREAADRKEPFRFGFSNRYRADEELVLRFNVRGFAAAVTELDCKLE